MKCIREGGRVGYINEDVCFHRRHKNNISSNDAFINNGFKKVAEKYSNINSIINSNRLEYAISFINRVAGIIPQDVLLLMKDRRLVAWGAGSTLSVTMKQTKLNLSYVVDSNFVHFENVMSGFQIRNPKSLKTEDKNRVFIYVSSMYFSEIYSELNSLGYQYRINYY